MAGLALCVAAVQPAFAQATASTSQETMVVTAKVDRIDKIARTITATTDKGQTVTVKAGPELRVFDSLKAGDTVVARVAETIEAAVAKPGAKPSFQTDTTQAAKAAGTGSANTDIVQQIKMTVTIESTDPAKKLVVYRTADNRVITREVADAKLIEGFKRGDIVEVTLTRTRAIELTKK
jgi:hypothetical protein